MTIDVHDLRVGPELVGRVRMVLQYVDASQRDGTIAAWAEALGGMAELPRLVSLLASAPEPEMRQLTMLVAARLPPPLDPRLVPVLRHLLRDRSVPEPALLALAAVLLRDAANDNDRNELLAALVAGLGKAQAVERLQLLEEHVGRTPAIDAYRSRIEDRIKLSCPRCDAELPRPQMIRHLWEEHRLLVDGRSVRDPWRLIEEWVEDYYQSRNPELLMRSRALAVRADPEDGLRRVHRLFLASQVADEQALDALLEEARLEHASLCPHCFTPTPVPADTVPEPLPEKPDTLEAQGFRVAVIEGGLFSRLEVETPDRLVYAGREPDRLLTPRGAAVAAALPPVLLALLLAVAFLSQKHSGLIPVVALLLSALLFAGAARILWRPRRPLRDRLVDYAWSFLVPRLHQEGFDGDDAAFLGGLALTSVGRGQPRVRADQLLRVIGQTERVSSTTFAPHLGALWHLAAEDAAAGGADPVALLVTQAARCFEGRTAMGFLEQLLSGWSPRGLPPGDRARLRVLLCDRAFEAGCEVRDLIEMAEVSPALAALLDTREPNYLMQLRLLWSLRPAVPWSACGAAATAFELAANVEAGRKHLGRHPDLLLAAWDIPGGYICASGMFFHEILFTEAPRMIELRARGVLQGGGFELVLGRQRFWFQTSPDALIGRLERWFSYYFREFRPRVAEVYGWPSYATLDNLRKHRVVKCPECEQKFRARTGEVGTAL